MHLSQLTPVIEDTLQKAGFEAAELKHELCEPGHLLIGILTMQKNTARTVLEDFQIGRHTLRLIVAGKYPQHEELSDFVDLSSAATLDVLDMMEHVAMPRLDHLLRALIENDPVIAVIFVELGISPKDILRRLDHKLAG